MERLIELIIIFIFFCFGGWCLEVMYRSIRNKRLINPGFMLGPTLPIYGSGCLLMYLIYSWNIPGIDNKWVLFAVEALMCGVLMTIIEFIAGFMSLKIYHNRLWDYSDRKGNVMGLICPTFSLIWTILGALFYFVFMPWIGRAANIFATNVGLILLTGFFAGIFITDLGYSLHLATKIRKYAKSIGEIVNFEELKQNVKEHFAGIGRKIKFNPFVIAGGKIKEFIETKTSSKSDGSDK